MDPSVVASTLNAIVAAFRPTSRSRGDLILENLALRQQLLTGMNGEGRLDTGCRHLGSAAHQAGHYNQLLPTTADPTIPAAVDTLPR